VLHQEGCTPYTIQHSHYYPLLVWIFEENGGFPNREQIDQLAETVKDKFSRRQILNWIWCERRRRNLHVSERENSRTILPRSRGATRGEIQRSEYYPLLVRVFEENGGFLNREQTDQLAETVKDQLSRMQIYKWFWAERQRRSIRINPTRNSSLIGQKFTERTRSLLKQAFVENSGYIIGKEKDALIDALGGDLTRGQISKWFCDERKRRAT